MSTQITCNDRTRTYWTPTMERFFIDLMLEHLHRGNRTGHTFNKQAWNEMLGVFNSKFGSQYDKDVLKSRYTNLWKQYNDVKSLLDHGGGGFSWDQTHQMVLGDESLWNCYLKAHPEARVYKTKPVLNFNDLCLIYGYTVADGRYSRSSHDLEFEDEINGVSIGESSSGSLVLSSKESSKTDWTPVMDQYFIGLMLDQIGRGNKTGNAFSKEAWTDMLALFNVRFSGQYGKRVLRHRYNKLSKYYKDMGAILKQDGFSWDQTLQMIAADDAVWNSYIKEHPLARTYRMRSLPSYSDLDIIFANPAEERSLPHPVQGKDVKDDALPDETKASQAQNPDRTRTFWTPPMDNYLIDLLVDQVNKGNRVGQTFITSAWNEMVTEFNTKFGSQHSKDVLKNRYKHLRRLYTDIKFLLEQNGFSWDTRRDMVVADDGVWNTYVKGHPEARPYRVKTIPSYPNLCFIFGKELSDGRYTRLAQAFDPSPAETVRINESGSTDGFEDALGKTHTFQINHAREEKNDYLCSSICPPCIEWTPVMDRCLIDLMLEQVDRGNKIGETFTEQAWADMAESFNAKFRLQADMFMLENRYILMMKERDDINNILNLDGFAWDEEKQTIVAEDECWGAYIKEHPDATIYKGKTLDSYGDLCKLYEHLSHEGFNCENLMIELDNYGHEIDTADDFSSTQKQHSKRPNPIPPLGNIVHKAQKTGLEMRKPLCEAEGGDDDDYTKPMPEDDIYSRIRNAIDALQALPDMDDELLLDACDLLEDERKAKTFLALDVSLRRKWLVRKLRPSANV